MAKTVNVFIDGHHLEVPDTMTIIEAADKIGGYMVHASKIRRAGIPIYLRHTILRAEGKESVEKAVISQLDEAWKPINGKEKEFDVDFICLAVGLHPLAELSLLICPITCGRWERESFCFREKPLSMRSRMNRWQKR